MRCPFCRVDNDRVIDSRSIDDGANIRRRRECLSCRRRFTTYERVERQALSVVKKGGVREPFDRDKIARSITTACRKRPVEEERIERVVNSIQRRLESMGESDIPSAVIGEMVMEALQGLDKVAYIRFASVYKNFREIKDFETFVETMGDPDTGNLEN